MKAIAALSAAAALTLLVFGIWPALDLTASALFFDGTGFPLATSAANTALRWVLRVTPFLPVLLGLAVLAAARWRPGPFLGLTTRGWAEIVLSFLLGPGLLVNRLLKTHWGRARPRDVTEFAGGQQFTPPHIWADECAANCSFVSGEVSAVTALSIALAMLLTANRARLGQGAYGAGLALVFTLPLLSAFQRISAGAHFLSDAVMAVLLTLITALVVRKMLAPKAR